MRRSSAYGVYCVAGSVCSAVRVCIDLIANACTKFRSGMLTERLASVGDPFDSGDAMIAKWGYITNENGTVPYKN